MTLNETKPDAYLWEIKIKIEIEYSILFIGSVLLSLHIGVSKGIWDELIYFRTHLWMFFTVNIYPLINSGIGFNDIIHIIKKPEHLCQTKSNRFPTIWGKSLDIVQNMTCHVKS